MKRGGWRDWGNLLHGLATAGMQCSNGPDLTRLCDQAVQLLPEKLAWGAANQAISMTLLAMAKSGYTGSAQPLLQSVTAAISQGMVLWHDKEVCRQLAERAVLTQRSMKSQEMANSLSMFLALSIHQAVSSGHSQLASEPQLNSMAAALQLVQALAAAGHDEMQQAVISQDGTHCTQLLVLKPGLTRGISVEESPNFLPDGSMSGVVAHVKLHQLTHFDAGVVVNKAVFDQLASDSERAAFMREQMLPKQQQDLEKLVSAVKELPFLSSSSQVEQTSQLLWCFADWTRQPENSRARLTQAHASSEAMKRGSWREWSNLLHGLATAGVQCNSSPDLTRLCEQAVQLLPGKLARGAAGQDISMTLWAMAKSGYTGNAQPLLQSVTAAITQGVSNILYAMGLVLWHDKE
ncbi:hypothetical protein HaLaN_28662, partial [Haematococcus lacustris]